MFTRRDPSGSSQRVSRAPLAPVVPTPSPGCIPRQAISIVLPTPPGLSWGMLGVGATLGLLLITGLSLGALAFRPRDPGPVSPSLSAQVAPIQVAAIPVVVPAVQSEDVRPLVPEKIDRPAVVPDEPEPAAASARPQAAPPPPAEPAPPVQVAAAPPAEPPPVLKPAEAVSESGGGTCGTSVAFLASPQLAARRAAEEGKILFTLHVSGNFEDPGFT
jgi:hypothetical protein